MFTAERFWSKVDVHGPDECWEWQCARHPQGYGFVKVNGKQRYAHRVAWELTNGPIPEGALIRHLICDNPPCCNPAHLFLGDYVANIQDAIRKGRRDNCRGEQHTEAKLTEREVLEIRWRYEQGGVFQKALAMEYAVSDSEIWFIVHHKNWKHLDK